MCMCMSLLFLTFLGLGLLFCLHFCLSLNILPFTVSAHSLLSFDWSHIQGMKQNAKVMFNVNQKSSEDPLFDFCFSYDVLSLSVSLCDLVKKFHLWSLACPGFLTCILSLWKNCAHLPSVSCQNSTQLLYSFLCVFLLPHKHTLPDFDRVPPSLLIFNISSELQRNDRIWEHFNKIME